MHDSSDTPTSAVATGTVGGLGELRRALEALLSDREPPDTLHHDLSVLLQAVPGNDWKNVVREVMGALLVPQVGEDEHAISITFNNLAGAVSSSGDPLNQELNGKQVHIQSERTANPPADVIAKPPVTISIDANQARTLKVIKHVPGYPLCQLEGRNGIGKSLAARLLELISGTQPYIAMPRAWATLKDQLGPTTVTITGLSAGRLQIDLTPEAWPEDPLEDLGDSLGKVTLNDRKINWSQARILLQVARISGDESLVDALAQALEEYAQQALLWRTAIRGVVESWDTPLLNIQDILSTLSLEYFESRLREAAAAKGLADELSNKAEETHAAAQAAANAQRTLYLAIQRREQVQPLMDELATLNATIAENRQSQESIERELLTVSRALGLDDTKRQQVRHWERLRRLRVNWLRDAQSEEDWFVLQLGDETRPTWDELSERQRQAVRQRQRAKELLADLDITGDVRELGEKLEIPLNEATATVLRKVIAATDVPLTGKALLEGLRRRRREIDGRPTSTELQDAKDKLEAAEHTERLLQSLESAMTKTDRKRSNLDEAEAALRNLLNQLQGSTQEDYETLLNQLRKLQEDYASKLQQRKGIRRRLARLLDLDVAAANEPEFSSTESNDQDNEEEEEEKAIEESDKFIALSEDDEDELDLPIEIDEWVTIWETLITTQSEELCGLKYQFEIDILRRPISRSVNDPLADALELASAKAEQTAGQERKIAEEVSEAIEKLQLEQRTIAEARRRLRTSAAMLINPTSEWKTWRPGFQALLDILGGTLDELSTLDSVEINVDDYTLAHQETVALKWTQSIAWICDRISYASGAIRDGLDSISRILKLEARNLSPRSRVPYNEGVDRLVPDYYKDMATVRHWAEGELAVLLNADALREALFDKASNVTLELDSAVVSWTAPGSSYESRRPLEAFSSGQQVFAYTRARLELLRSRPNWRGHRLVFLDEFGAFVARDRFAQLLEFVYQQALGLIADQIVVMLPLSSDFANEAYAQELVRGASDPRRRSDLLDRVNQVHDNGYFAAPVDGAK